MENKMLSIKFNNEDIISKIMEKYSGAIQYKAENVEIYEKNISEPSGPATRIKLLNVHWETENETIFKIKGQYRKIIKYQEKLQTGDGIIPPKKELPNKIKNNGKTVIVIITGKPRKCCKCGEPSYIKREYTRYFEYNSIKENENEKQLKSNILGEKCITKKNGQNNRREIQLDFEIKKY